MGIDKASSGYTPSKDKKLKVLSEEYGVSFYITKRIATLNNYNMLFVIDELKRLIKNEKEVYSDRLKEHNPNNNLE